MKTLINYGRRRICELGLLEEGLAATEYTVVLGLLVVAVLATLLLFGDGIVSAVSYVSRQFADGSTNHMSAR